MRTRDQPVGTAPAPVSAGHSAGRRPDVATLLAAVTAGASIVREPRAARERFEEELRVALNARSISVREEATSGMPPPPNVLSVEIPIAWSDVRARLEAAFEAPRPMDDGTCQLLEAAAHVAAILLDLERAGTRLAPSPARRPDGAAPLIGSSEPMKRVRDRIERVAATDFTILIAGASGPEPHPAFIEVFREASLGGGYGAVEGAVEGAEEAEGKELV